MFVHRNVSLFFIEIDGDGFQGGVFLPVGRSNVIKILESIPPLQEIRSMGACRQ